MDAGARNEGKRVAVSDVLRRLAGNEPVLVVVEDLHWADEVTLEQLASLTMAVAECSALMVMTSRVEGDPINTTWRARTGESPIVTWDLSPLRPEESVALVTAFIDASDALAKRCIERAAGNPLFLEQLLHGLEEETSESVPDSIQSLVLTRLDHLPDADKRALRAASVLGPRFELDGLRRLLDEPSYDCGDLIEHRFVRHEGPLYLFAHALIRDSVYVELPRFSGQVSASVLKSSVLSF